MNEKISDIISTTDEQAMALKEIDLLINSLYSTEGGDFEKVLSGSVRNVLTQFVKKDKDYLVNLKEEINKLEVFHITLAYEPSSEGINRILTWIRKNVNPNIILDVTHDPSVVAGLTVTFRGKYIDLSINNSLSGTFKDKYVDIMNTIIKHE